MPAQNQAQQGSLTRALSRAVSCALVGGAGCAGDAENLSGPAALPPPEAFATAACLGPGESGFAQMQLAREFDFIATRSVLFAPGSTEAGTRADGQALGTACAGARDPSQCQAELAASWPTSDSPWQYCRLDGCIYTAVVLTSGDEVRMFDSAAELRQLLGKVDTPDEAMLLALAEGFLLGCGRTGIATMPGGYALRFEELVDYCPARSDEVTLVATSNGSVRVAQRIDLGADPSGVCIGRRPEGLLSSDAGPPVSDASGAGLAREDVAVGQFFADVSRLEQSAVTAFQVMAAELAAFGAPRSLQRAALRAARDEVRHAELTAGLARRHGVEPLPAQIEPRPLRSLFAFALDNVIEGCVRETYGAACASYQAQRARARQTREQLWTVARDEARHAQLSWRIHDWVCSLASELERAELARAAHHAIAELQLALTRDWGHPVRREAGMPGPEAALAMFTSLEAELWRPAGFGGARSSADCC